MIIYTCCGWRLLHNWRAFWICMWSRAMICGLGALFFFFGVMMLGNAQMLTIGNLLFLAGIMVRSYPNENSCSGDFDATTLMSEFDSILAGFLRGFLYTCVFVQLTFTNRTSLYSIHLLMFRKMLMGPKSTFSFFQSRWAKQGPVGVICFFLGVFMVMLHKRIGWWCHPIFGIIIEVFGFINLFGKFFVTVLRVSKNMPVCYRYTMWLTFDQLIFWAQNWLRNFFIFTPSPFAFLQIIGWILNLPGISHAV